MRQQLLAMLSTNIYLTTTQLVAEFEAEYPEISAAIKNDFRQNQTALGCGFKQSLLTAISSELVVMEKEGLVEKNYCQESPTKVTSVWRLVQKD